MSKAVAPYGSWPSPVTADLLVEAVVRLSDLTADGSSLYWVESRPEEAGRQVLVRLDSGTGPRDLTPPGFSVRSQVHEYGGRCFAVSAETAVFSNWADQRLWARTGASPPRPLTPEPGAPRSLRYADPDTSPDGRWLVCVHERHDPSGRVDNLLACVDLRSTGTAGEVRVVASGHDFYGAPRISPDGTRLAWVTWDHPDMPWDSSQLWIAELGPGFTPGPPRRVAGGEGESVTQPRWSPSGALHYVSDRSGWWNLYREPETALFPLEAEFAEPDWAFGNSTYDFTPDGSLVAVWSGPGGQRMGLVGEERVEEVDTGDLSRFSCLQATAGSVYAIAGSPRTPPAVVRIDLATGGHRVLRRSRQVPLDEADISCPVAVAFPTGGGQVAHALHYPPVNRSCCGPPGERPPVMVVIHGGPTGSASAVLDLGVQYWTSRGFAVVAVDYRGSAGYGRAYRRLLDGSWGVADVEDCAAAVSWLDSQGTVDGARAVIRGGSAGGFTTLAALAFTDAFAAGGSHYGVADLAALARDTHKFESRYLDRLVGRWPEDAGEYRRRSPIGHVEQIDAPLILFQGLEDRVVPPDQSRSMFEALRERGVPVAYLEFEGEQHGFRRSETITAVALAELEFYGRVLGFEPDAAPAGPPLEIANEQRLIPRP